MATNKTNHTTTMTNNQSAAQLVGERYNQRQFDLQEAERNLRVFEAQYDDLAFGHRAQLQFDALVNRRDCLKAQANELVGLLGALNGR